MKEFNDRARPRTAEGKNKKRSCYKSAYAFYEGGELMVEYFR